jgi:hypothetical protein
VVLCPALHLNSQIAQRGKNDYLIFITPVNEAGEPLY